MRMTSQHTDRGYSTLICKSLRPAIIHPKNVGMIERCMTASELFTLSSTDRSSETDARGSGGRPLPSESTR